MSESYEIDFDPDYEYDPGEDEACTCGHEYGYHTVGERSGDKVTVTEVRCKVAECRCMAFDIARPTVEENPDGGDAWISPDGLYRYRLDRVWDDNGPRICWVMLNPSTADATVDDPTIRRCIAFSKARGAGSLVVVNRFALRATDPKALSSHPDPCGPENEAAVRRAVSTSWLTVAAWGAHPMAERGTPLPDGVRPLCLGATKSGAPRHPLYVRADQRFVPWPVPTVEEKP